MNSLQLADSSMTPQAWAAVVLGLLTILYAVFLRPKMRQKKDPLSRPFGLPRQREVERQMETLLVELSDMARQVTAQIDTRAAKLEALIGQADQKIAALRSNPAPAEPASPADVGPDFQTVEDPRHVAIYELADSGMNAAQIAQRLSRPRGEIELILALRSRQ